MLEGVGDTVELEGSASHALYQRARCEPRVEPAVLGRAGPDLCRRDPGFGCAAPGIPRAYPPIPTNWAATATYHQIGLQLPGLVGNHPVTGPAEIGVIDYYCNCEVYEYFSDRGHFPAELARYERRLGAIGKPIMRLNSATWTDLGARTRHSSS